MDNVLIAAGSDSAAQLLEGLVREQYPGVRTRAATGGARVRRLLQEQRFDALLLSAPLQDENGLRLATEAASDPSLGVVLLVKTDIAQTVSPKVEEHGVFVVEKPVNRGLFFQALRLLAASTHRLQGLETQRDNLQRNLEELRMVDKAKMLLIQHRGLNETLAHRYIEKEAMDSRRTKGAVAKDIIQMYSP